MKSNIEDLLNSGIKQLVPYEPGKPIEDVEKDLGIKNIIKLASNENPLGPSPKALQAIKTSLRISIDTLTVMVLDSKNA